MADKAIWTCKIGPADRDALDQPADEPMRKAVQAAFREVTGHDEDYCFSGWGGALTEAERAVVEDREPEWPASSLDEAAWGLIANAWGGDWTLASDEWRAAAERWRDAYHATLANE